MKNANFQAITNQKRFHEISHEILAKRLCLYHTDGHDKQRHNHFDFLVVSSSFVFSKSPDVVVDEFKLRHLDNVPDLLLVCFDCLEKQEVVVEFLYEFQDCKLRYKPGHSLLHMEVLPHCFKRFLFYFTQQLCSDRLKHRVFLPPFLNSV